MRRKLLRNKGIRTGPVKNEKINYLGLSAIIIGLVVLNAGIYFYVSIDSEEPIYGTVVMLNDTTSESGARQKIVVKLENGKKVQAVLPNTLPFRKGSTAKLIKTKTKLFGVERYRFAGYQ